MIRPLLIASLIFFSVNIFGQNQKTRIDTFVLDDLIERLDSMFENGILFSPFDDDFHMEFDKAFPDMREFILKYDSLGIEDFDLDELYKLHGEWDFSDEELEGMMDFGMQLLKGMNMDSLNNIFDSFNIDGFDFDFFEPYIEEIQKSDTIAPKEKPLKKI